MDSDDKSIMITVCWVAFLIIIGPASCISYYKTAELNAVTDMVKNGADPIEAGCAVSRKMSDILLCADVVRANRGQ